MMPIEVRLAHREELPRINELRLIVNRLHAEGRPDIFRNDFCEELVQHVYEVYEQPNTDVLAAVLDGTVIGYAMVAYISRPESPYNHARSFYHVEEFGVDPACRRMGAATALVEYMKQDARARSLPKIELDMWEFNQGALAFYEQAGFRTYRRYMELPLDEQV